MKKILNEWRKYLEEANSIYNRALTNQEKLKRAGDVRAMFRNELEHILTTAYFYHGGRSSISSEKAYSRMRNLVVPLDPAMKARLAKDVEAIAEFYKLVESGMAQGPHRGHTKVAAGGWPMWVKNRTGETEVRYSSMADVEYEAPVYQTRYLGPAEDPTSVFNGQAIQELNEPHKEEILEKVKEMLEAGVPPTTIEAPPSPMEEVIKYYGLEIRPPEDPVPEPEPIPEPSPRELRGASRVERMIRWGKTQEEILAAVQALRNEEEKKGAMAKYQERFPEAM